MQIRSARPVRNPLVSLYHSTIEYIISSSRPGGVIKLTTAIKFQRLNMVPDWHNGVLLSRVLLIPVPEQTTQHLLDKEVAFLEEREAIALREKHIWCSKRVRNKVGSNSASRHE
jgi:hypothetical protein